MKSERGDFVAGAAGGVASGLMGDSGDSGDNGAQGIQDAGNQMYARGQMTPEELKQYQGSFDTGNTLQQIYLANMGIGSYPTGYQNAAQQYQNQGDLSKSLYNQATTQAQNPYAGWESSLQPNLALATQNVNQQSNQRGLLNSGINLESLGRAGVEAAVADAQGRMQYGQQSFQNAYNVNSAAENLGQQNTNNISNLYNSQQGYGLTGMNRQAGQAQAAAQYQAYPYQAQLGSYYGGVAAAQALPGQLIGAAGQIGAGAMMLA